MIRLTRRLETPLAPAATLTLPLEQRVKGRLRVTLDDGREAGLFLERGPILRHGDCIATEEGLVVQVLAAPEPVSLVRCDDPLTMARACYHLGNRHTPLQILPGEVRYQHDHVLDEMLRRMGLSPGFAELPFEPEPGPMASMAPIITMPTDMSMGIELARSRLRLLQLGSPSLPIGGFTYSQGLEYAVEAGWVTDLEQVRQWLEGLLEDSFAMLDVPLLARLHDAVTMERQDLARDWCDWLLAARESAELRREEIQRGRALARLLLDLDLPGAQAWHPVLQRCQLASWAFASVRWGLSADDSALGLAWSWLEGQVAAAVKLVPLGQTDGQRLQLQLSDSLATAVQRGLSLPDDEIGASAPLLAIASGLHETQYTRLFRS